MSAKANIERDESTYFLLRLTVSEKKKLIEISNTRNISLTSLIRHLLQNNLSIQDL